MLRELEAFNEIIRLHSENAQLKFENATLQAENTKLRQSIYRTNQRKPICWERIYDQVFDDD